jgi:hypothetical protein
VNPPAASLSLPIIENALPPSDSHTEPIAAKEEKILQSAPKKPKVARPVEIIVWPFATIALNGEVQARNQKSVLLNLEEGTYTLTFTHAYAATVEKIITVAEDKTPLKINVSLDRSKPAFLIVKSNIDGDVAIDGSYKGSAQKSQAYPIVVPLPDKRHAETKEIIVSQENFVPVIMDVEFIAGQTKEIEVILKPAQQND